MFKQRLITVLATQITSIIISAMIIFADLDMNNTPEQAETYGGTLTVFMILLGLTMHFRATRQPLPLGLIALLGVIAPAFAYASGPLLQVGGYHLLALGFHGIGLRAQYRLEHQKPHIPHPAEDRDDDGGAQ